MLDWDTHSHLGVDTIRYTRLEVLTHLEAGDDHKSPRQSLSLLHRLPPRDLEPQYPR